MRGRVTTLLVLVALATSACGWVQDQAAPTPEEKFVADAPSGATDSSGTNPDGSPATDSSGNPAADAGSDDGGGDSTGPDVTGDDNGTAAPDAGPGSLDPSNPLDPSSPDPIGETPVTLPEVVLLPACAAFVDARRIGFEIADAGQIDSVTGVVLLVADARQRMITIRDEAPSQAVQLYAGQLVDVSGQLETQLATARTAEQGLAMVRDVTGQITQTMDSLIGSLEVFCPVIR